MVRLRVALELWVTRVDGRLGLNVGMGCVGGLVRLRVALGLWVSRVDGRLGLDVGMGYVGGRRLRGHPSVGHWRGEMANRFPDDGDNQWGAFEQNADLVLEEGLFVLAGGDAAIADADRTHESHPA